MVLLLLSNVVQNAVIGNDNSLLGGMFGAVVLVAVNAVVVRVFRSSDRADRVFEGSATTLVTEGELDRRAIWRVGLRPADVVNALRRQGASTIDEVDTAELTPGGGIVVKLRADAENATAGDIARLEAKLDRLLDQRAG